MVVEDRRGNRGGEADGRRDQRLGDAGRDDGETRRTRLPDLLEGRDDADHGAEEADERRRAAGRREELETALEPMRLARRRPRDLSLDRAALQIAESARQRATRVARDAPEFSVRLEEDLRDRAVLEVARDFVCRVERSLVVHLEKRLAILGRATKLAPLERDDRPRHDGSGGQREEDELDDPSGLTDQPENVETRETHPPVRRPQREAVPLSSLDWMTGQGRRRCAANQLRVWRNDEGLGRSTGTESRGSGSAGDRGDDARATPRDFPRASPQWIARSAGRSHDVVKSGDFRGRKGESAGALRARPRRSATRVAARRRRRGQARRRGAAPARRPRRRRGWRAARALARDRRCRRRSACAAPTRLARSPKRRVLGVVPARRLDAPRRRTRRPR